MNHFVVNIQIATIVRINNVGIYVVYDRFDFVYQLKQGNRIKLIIWKIEKNWSLCAKCFSCFICALF